MHSSNDVIGISEQLPRDRLGAAEVEHSIVPPSSLDPVPEYYLNAYICITISNIV